MKVAECIQHLRKEGRLVSGLFRLTLTFAAATLPSLRAYLLCRCRQRR